MSETTEKMVDIFGDRWYAEIQWNNVEDQHKLKPIHHPDRTEARR
jgi:hypothetical protein